MRTLQCVSVICMIGSVAFSSAAPHPSSDDAGSTTTVVVEPITNVAQEIAAIFSAELEKQQANGAPWLREAHAKQHGCVKAEVTVLPDLPVELARGIFENVTTYPAFIRFSNGVGRGFALQSANESDTLPDGRGFGLKIFTGAQDTLIPSNGSVDWTFTTSRLAFFDKPENALSLFQAVQSGALSIAKFFAIHPELALLYAKFGTDGLISDLLDATFYTAPARLHGPTPAKFRLVPCESSTHDSPDLPCLGFDCLMEALQSDLASTSGCFNWQIQLYSDESSTPVDDLTVEWKTPYTTIARIDIFSQTQSWGSAQQSFCRHMSFNDWRNLEAHQPVGFVQDIRKVVYETQAALRHDVRGEPNTQASVQDWLNYWDM